MALQLKKISIFKGITHLFHPITLAIEPGEIATIMGPSGCGKSTLLSFISGSIDPYFSFSGEVVLNGKEVTNLAMEEREIGILFQDDLLFPHMSVGSNLAFAIHDKTPKEKKREMIREALKTADLENFEHRDPMRLSGGQRARISLLRTLLANPKALLLDEPFSKLDHTLKKRIRQFVFSQVEKMKIPALLVTHDPMDCPKDGRVITLTYPER